MIEILLVIAAFLVFVTLLILGWGIGSYNIFRIGQQDIKTQWSNICTEYQRRADLFLNLVSTVKSYKKFEKETIIAVTQARSGNFGQTKATQIKELKKLDSVFQRMLLTFEAYPNLKSNEQHNKLMEEIRITEDRVNVARTDYNEIVGDYNKLVTTFPKNIIAGMFRFNVEQFFKNEETTDKAPKIDLSD